MTSGSAAFFDVDNTIVRGASSYHLARELHRRGMFRRRDIVFFAAHAFYYFLFGENKKHIARVQARALATIEGHSVAEMLAVAEELYEQVLTHRIFPGARDLLNDHLAQGDQVWIVTAAPREVGELVARRLNLTGVLGTVAEEQDGVYTGRLVGDMMHGQHKAAAVREIAEREGLDLAECAAYGDSSHDIPMLRTVGEPCAINPDPRLRLFAADIGWPVRDFRRRRRNVRSGLRTAGQAGAVWAVATGLRALSKALLRRLVGHRQG
ncbi:HAD family hydrolase [Pseudactinotalea sp. Z1732]|uniref:HAD family hydrolase n=1 Tax=Micrococcales TaxID=85006 RepID=UPI003C7B8A7F